MINTITKEEALKRLKRIEGQIKGIQKMVDQERYCIDIINQITAVHNALDSVALKVMKRHIETCVSDAIKSTDGKAKIAELMDTVEHFIK